jgi:hypothetical protein
MLAAAPTRAFSPSQAIPHQPHHILPPLLRDHRGNSHLSSTHRYQLICELHQVKARAPVDDWAI